MYQYTVMVAEPGYSGSEKTVLEHANLNGAISKWFECQRKYKKDPDNNPSYCEIRLEGHEHEVEYAGEDIMYGRDLGPQNPYTPHLSVWEMRKRICDERKRFIGK